MTAIFYAAGAVLVAAGLCIGAIWVYGYGKQKAQRRENAVHRQLLINHGKALAELADAHAVIDAQAEELTETDRALAALRASVDKHRGPRTLAGRPAVLTPEQRELAAEDAAWKRSQDGQGIE